MKEDLADVFKMTKEDLIREQIYLLKRHNLLQAFYMQVKDEINKFDPLFKTRMRRLIKELEKKLKEID